MADDLFGLDLPTFLGILVMSVVTVGLKAGGYYTQTLVRPGPRVTRFLGALPGCVILSMVVPMALSAGTTGVAAIAAAVPVMLKTGNTLLATAAGVAAGLLLRHGAGW